MDNIQEYKKEKFMSILRVTKETFTESGFLNDDIVIKMKAELWTQTQDSKAIILDRPTFLEWLFRIRRKVVVTARDVLLDPPNNNENTIRLYQFELPD